MQNQGGDNCVSG